MTIDPKHGGVERLHEGTHIVRMLGKSYLLEQPGVFCENPDAQETERIYAKRFERKRIYLPDEAELARGEVLSFGEQDTINIGMTGYSSIKHEDCAAWGIQPGAYERACEEILANMVLALRNEFPGLKIGVCDGASDMGVDRAVINASRALDIPHLGHSCPGFMMYVQDDDDPVLVSATQEDYSNAFIDSLNFLCSVGGREHALMHDIVACIIKNKKVLVFDLIRSISTNRSGPPARDEKGKVQDATAAFLETIKMFQPIGQTLNPYEDLRNWVREAVVRETRKLVTPLTAFSSWKQEADV
jgi:hypothetical protein